MTHTSIVKALVSEMAERGFRQTGAIFNGVGGDVLVFTAGHMNGDMLATVPVVVPRSAKDVARRAEVAALSYRGLVSVCMTRDQQYERLSAMAGLGTDGELLPPTADGINRAPSPFWTTRAVTRTNREIIEAFADQFDPPLTICQTQNINGKPVKDAWLANYWDKERRIGITAHAVKGRLHAFLECENAGDVAEAAGQMMARALKRAAEPTVLVSSGANRPDQKD